MSYNTREIHPLEPQRHRHSMLAPRVYAPRVTRCSLGHVIWSVQLACSILSRSDSCQGDGRQRHLMMHGQCPIPVYSSQIIHREIYWYQIILSHSIRYKAYYQENPDYFQSFCRADFKMINLCFTGNLRYVYYLKAKWAEVILRNSRDFSQSFVGQKQDIFSGNIHNSKEWFILISTDFLEYLMVIYLRGSPLIQ